MSWNYLNCPVGNRIWQRGWRVQTQWPHVLLQKPKAWGVDNRWQPSLHLLPVLHVRQHHGAQQPAQVSPASLCMQRDSCVDLCHWMLIQLTPWSHITCQESISNNVHDFWEKKPIHHLLISQGKLILYTPVWSVRKPECKHQPLFKKMCCIDKCKGRWKVSA